MTASDLRQRVRDRSVVIFGLVVPLALMFVFNLTIGSTDDLALEPITVSASVPAGDQLAATLVSALAQVDAFAITVDEVPADEARSQVRSGKAQLAVVVPDGFGEAVQRGGPAVVDVTEGEGSGIETQIALSVMQGVLDHLSASAVVVNAGLQSGVAPDQLGALAQQAGAATPTVTLTEGKASTEQLSTSGALVAGQAGLFLLFTVGFGVLGLVAEREQGTMARLRSMPMRPGLIVAAKGLVSYILGVVATTVLLTVGARFFEVSFGSPVAVAALVLCAVAAATSLMFIIARVARTAEQASVAQSILALVLGVAGGAFFPLTATGLAGRLLDLNPIAAFTRGLGITSGGGGLMDIGVPVVIMLGFAVVGLAVSRLVPGRGREL
ncbi:ABC transporter permease [Cellulomonas sp. WB94]|uniref:ABC transporter permease n=1 Tax=Cellulomonas sp. WB94 TaxID=2173174 RepID=UPI000D566263|nr:ABC transporter permease [Cellulomonas sp. WB94]PVU84050.1 ABC transporter permease [Cellulomonas sp. WB94]